MTGLPVLEPTGSASDPLEAHQGAADADPLRPLAEAGFGWLVEHVDFLREPLDWLAGCGDRFDDAVATWNQTATTLDGIVRRRAGGGWLTAEIAGMSRLCSDVAAHVAEVRVITDAIHRVFRDVIALFVREVFDNATVALAAAGITCGGSLSELAAWAVARGGVVLDRITRRSAELACVVVRVLGALKALFGKARDMLKAITRFGE